MSIDDSNIISGNLDIFALRNEEELDGDKIVWNEVLIHGDPDGLKSLAYKLIEIANSNQEEIDDNSLPNGARLHFHLKSGIDISSSSNDVIIGRLDAKKTKEFYKRYIPNKFKK